MFYGLDPWVWCDETGTSQKSNPENITQIPAKMQSTTYLSSTPQN